MSLAGDYYEELCSTKKKLESAYGRIIELESAIRWLVNEKLKDCGDTQYGKGGMRDILLSGCMPPITDVSKL
jgi:hypothetical protein